ncbi:MAG: hypothetical protein ACRBCI_01590 [Cellvibrionaceae bacterium]
MNKKQILLEEIKLLQPIIARQDEFQFKIKVLAMTIFSGLTIALFTFKTTLPSESYFTISLILSLCFWLIGGIYGGDETRAVKRVAELEEIFKDQSKHESYKGPAISGSLSFWELQIGELLKVYAYTLFHPRAWAPFLGLILLSYALSKYVG